MGSRSGVVASLASAALGMGWAVSSAAGCASAPVAPDTSGNPEVTSEKDAQDKLGTKVRVVGEAGNAKLSAAVMGEGFVVYLIEMRGWPDAVEGKQVEATGILGRRDEVVARPPDSPDGATAGTDKPIYVLREASYLILDD